MANFRKFYNKITEDTTIEDKISEKKTKDKTKKGAYVSKGDSKIDPYGLQPTPGDLYKSPFEIRIVLDQNDNEIKKELVEL